jgi:four helix bundle protein
VPCNIAEGQARQGKKEFVQFLSHAEGSLAGLDTQLSPAVELGYYPHPDAQPTVAAIAELKKMIASLRRRLAVWLSTSS